MLRMIREDIALYFDPLVRLWAWLTKRSPADVQTVSREWLADQHRRDGTARP